MHGNVWEWCEDGGDNHRTVRGGCWSTCEPNHLRSAERWNVPFDNRDGDELDISGFDLGFRVARSL